MSLVEYFEKNRDDARKRMDFHASQANWDAFSYQLGKVIAYGIAIRKLEMQKDLEKADKECAE